MPLRVLVCPQEFKGSLTATEAALSIAAGIRRALPDADIHELPMADGGPGTLLVLAASLGAPFVHGTYRGPLGDAVEADFALAPAAGEAPPTAIIEAATTAGLALVSPALRDPGHASTSGVGEQIARALDAGARKVIIGVGGTGTNDGGAGAAQALGYRLLDSRGRPLPPGPLALHWLARIDSSEAHPALRDAEVLIAADVTNPLLGQDGATVVYGPQKGVNPALGRRIEAALTHWARICRRDLGVDIASLEGSGAGGGLAAGLVAATGGRIGSGASIVADAVGLRARIEQADLVVTGEGQLDAQTERGKTVAYVASLAHELGRPCLAVAGSILVRPPHLDDAESVTDELSVEEAMSQGRAPVEAAAERLARRIRAAGTSV